MKRESAARVPSMPFERALLAALFAFGALLFAGTFAIDASAATPPDLGPRFVPRAYSCALMLFSAIAFGTFRATLDNRTRYDRTVLVTMAVAVGYALALPVLGYVISTFVTLAIVLFALRAGAWYRSLTFAAALTAVIYVVFERLMLVGLPAGPWRF